ncbi:hypothetical protein ACIQAC_32235 [Streptomyces sp. NPDC088387]|uniref:hypothetical protein n=1 Tax=Streptomyces sp. NPDC088387 TaxID=3365859 RepID=UPI0037FA2A24
MIVAWSGLGWLTFPILFVGIAIGSVGGSQTLGPAIGGAVACVVLWFWGRHLNRFGRDHTMWAVPMHWWGASLLAFGAGTTLLVLLYDG